METMTKETTIPSTVALLSPGDVPLVAANLIGSNVSAGCARDGPLKDVATTAIDNLSNAIESLPVGSHEFLYSMRLLLTIQLLMSTVVSESWHYNRRLASAMKEMDARNGSASKAERFSCILASALKLLFMCGNSLLIVSLVVTALFAAGVPLFEAPVSGDGAWRSIAGILALTFMGVCGRTLFIEHRIKKNNRRHRKMVARIVRKYCKFLARRYKDAMTQAMLARDDLAMNGGPQMPKIVSIDEAAFVCMVIGLTTTTCQLDSGMIPQPWKGD